MESSNGWARLKPFRGVEVARTRYLDREELRRLLNACAPDLRELVLGAVYTRGRYAALTALRSEDFRAETGTI